MAAGDRFVPISREMIEGWLNDNFKKSPYQGWQRVSRESGPTAGVYIVKFSEHVGARISTTLTRGDEVKGLGKGSTKVYLVRVSDNGLLNRVALKGILQRTKGWKKNWLAKVVKARGVYLEGQDFYDSIAEIEDVAAFAAEWKAKLESIPNWEADKWLAKAHANLSRGRTISKAMRGQIDRKLPTRPQRDEGLAEAMEWKGKIESVEGWESNDFLKAMWDKLRHGRSLSDNMKRAIERVINGGRGQRPSRPEPTPAPSPGSGLTEKQKAFLVTMRAMKDMAAKAGDDWTVGFLNSLITKAGRGGSFSPRQKEILREKMRVYPVPAGRRASCRVADAFVSKQGGSGRSRDR